MRILSCAVLLVLAQGLMAGDSVDRWAHENTRAHRALLDVFEGHPNFRGKFKDVCDDDARIVAKWVVFLAERGDRNTKDFVEKEGRDAKGIRQMHENYPEQVRDFRNWVRDYERAAVVLAEVKDGFRRALETPVHRHDDDDKKKKKRD